MEIIAGIKLKPTVHSRIDEADLSDPGFGKYMSDHMFTCKFIDGEWMAAQVIPFGDMLISPAALALHYGQSVFEGMKAFRMQDGRINIFRLEKHWERLNSSLHRMCMPKIPKELFTGSLRQLVDIDRNWVPMKADTALYLRPFVFASEAKMGVKVSEEYTFVIITGPVEIIYAKPIRVKVEREFIRAAKGGTGYAKCSGNYGAAFYPTQQAKAQGYDQVLWTDATEHQYIEESGMMNVMFIINDKLITPALSDSILDGVTRDSLIVLAREMGLQVEERKIGVDELKLAFLNKTITEAFGAGTAAVVAPIATIGIDEREYHLPAYSGSNIMFKLKSRLDALRTGIEKDVFRWNSIID
ncbi:MAG: branched-chain amino acid aminotransferase [Chitinophagaceae bacterium]|jgi:branched-chain amino acid aminotransferase|nr:branched-chain amino acid aminotransferase [Chitinophagaceae bacterium]